MHCQWRLPPPGTPTTNRLKYAASKSLQVWRSQNLLKQSTRVHQCANNMQTHQGNQASNFEGAGQDLPLVCSDDANSHCKAKKWHLALAKSSAPSAGPIA
mmetsp:Transcript_3110/g.8218  ORF Transcript_3110/g.8218 Transcript_3110/m.8218 type:complete len:100 (-) Transcript_3110:600-899(-)|eukprot:122890-Pelagomonas_calceolata.AAC.2